jgi:phosphopantetheinyl transferase
VNEVNLNCVDTSIGTIYYVHSERPLGTSKRDFQKYLIDSLLQRAGFSRKDLTYKASGQPQLTGDKSPFISISHSGQFGALYLAKQQVGVDIQTFHTKISRGKDYFLNDHERQFTSDDELHIVWAAKEVVFKSCEGNFTDARKEITVTKIDSSASVAHVNYGEHQNRIGFYYTTAFILAYSLD